MLAGMSRTRETRLATILAPSSKDRPYLDDLDFLLFSTPRHHGCRRLGIWYLPPERIWTVQCRFYKIPPTACSWLATHSLPGQLPTFISHGNLSALVSRRTHCALFRDPNGGYRVGWVSNPVNLNDG